MPFNLPLPAENTDPWYGPLVVDFVGGLRTFVNTLEQAVDGKAEAADVTEALGIMQSQMTAISTVANAAIPATQKGANSGVATLDAQGKLVTSQLPAIAIAEFKGSVATQAAMLAVTGEQSDWVIRTDRGTVFVITGNPAVVGGWTEMAYPTAPVLSVNGKTGAIALVPLDIGAASATDLNNVNTKADDAIAAAAAAQATADARATTASVTAAMNAATAAQTTANAAIPKTGVISAIGVKGVFDGYVLNANDVVPVGVDDYDLIIRRTA